MNELSEGVQVIQKVCRQLSSDKTEAFKEVIAAAALVTVMAGMNDDQAVSALRLCMDAIRPHAVDPKAAQH